MRIRILSRRPTEDVEALSQPSACPSKTTADAPGALDAASLSRHLQACDLMLQPYADGVSCRRTSFMAGLAHGKAIVTTAGPSTESFWAGSGTAVIVATDDAQALADAGALLLADTEKRRCLGIAAARLYRERFTVENTVSALREGMN